MAAMAKEQANMDSIGADEDANYLTAKADPELGLSVVQKAVGVLRDCYAGAAALLQDEQPAKPENTPSWRCWRQHPQPVGGWRDRLLRHIGQG